MIFKLPHMKDQLNKCSSDLRAIANFADNFSKELCGKEIVITRVTDAVEGESGVHPAGRAFDARFQTSGGYYYTEEESVMIMGAVNSRFPRHDGRLTCIIHSFNGGMEHFHFQIPIMIPKEWGL